jgi:predicted ester cyclase
LQGYEQEGKPMPEEALRTLGRRFREDLWNSGDLAIATELLAPDCRIHARIPLATDFSRGPESLRQLVQFYRLAFSEIRVVAEQLVVEGDTVVVRWTARGRHTGDLLGLPPTFRETVTTGIDVLRVAGGRIVEGWVSWDVLALLEQLLLPEGGSGAEEPAAGPGFLALLERLLR